MNVILGSGIIGLIAKSILGNDWKLIPFYKSRFFTFNPALDDNFIIRDETVDAYINELSAITREQLRPQLFLYNRAWSLKGDILKNDNSEVRYSWLYKIFGNQIPPQSDLCLKDKLKLFVYDIRVNQLYEKLMSMYNEELSMNAKEGHVEEIGKNYYMIHGKKYEFEKAVNTIPLNILLKLCKKNMELPSKPVHYLHVQTENLDFEGNNQLLVADDNIDFYKVTNIARNRYLFYCHRDIPNPGHYLMTFMRNFEIIDGTSVADAIPLGIAPKLDSLEDMGIYCVGSYAQWDWCMDISSCILRLLRYNNRDNNPGKMASITNFH